MATGAVAGEGQLQRIIRDLHDAVAEITKEYKENSEPITDDSSNLQKFSYKLEYLLQFDQKEKTTFLGTRKDYWDYFSDCLAKIKGANDGIRFVKSIPELKTSLGKGRAFIRYSLVHQRLADTLQQCLMNQRATSDWYYARSPFLKPHLSVDIISYLYELNEVQFDLASRGHDLDSAWPTFARRTLGMTNSPSHMWKPPSRSSSINSLASTYSQQAHELPCSPDFGQGLLGDLTEPLSDSTSSAAEELRLELDQSELKQRELVEQLQQLGGEATELREVVTELQRQLDISLAAQANHQELQLKLEALNERERILAQELDVLRAREAIREAAHQELQGKLAGAERKNEELMAKLDGVLEEKGQRAASHFDSAQKIHELLDGLKEAEKGRIEALAEGEEKRRQAERLAEDLRMKEQALKDGEMKIVALTEKAEKLTKQAEDQRNAVDELQGALVVRDKEASNLQKQLQDLQCSLETMEKQTMEEKTRNMEEREELQKKLSSLKESLEGKVQSFTAQLKTKETELLSSAKRIKHLEGETERLRGERQSLSGNVIELESSSKDQAKKIDEYKEQCTSLMEVNGKLVQTVKRNEETRKELAESKAALESELAVLRASEKQIRGQLNDAKVTVDEREQRMREENRELDEKLQKAKLQAEEFQAVVRKLEQENRDLKEEHGTLKASLGTIQDELRNSNGQIADLEKSLGASRRNEANLTLQLKDRDSQLEDRERLCEQLQARVEELEIRERELEAGNAEAERAFVRQKEMMERLEVQCKTVEKAQKETSACQAKEAQEMVLKVAMLEEQLGLNVKEVSRLQEEVVDLKAKLHSAMDEKVKVQARLDVKEASCEELQALTEQLKKQAEEQNRAQVSELLQYRERMEETSSELGAEISTRAKIEARLAAAQEEVSELKAQNNRLVLESAETKEGLHRANTEMAELGMTICRLTAEREEARELWTAEASRIQELKEQGKRETERLTASMAALRQENASLQEELQQTEKLPETVLELKELLDKAESEREAAREEAAAVRFQMSTENMAHQNRVKNWNEELESLTAQLRTEREKTSSLEAKVSDLVGVNSDYSHLMEEKDSHITKTESLMRERENEILELRESVKSAEDALRVAQKEQEELGEKLEKVVSEAQAQQLKMTAEIDDLGHTKSTLEERLIELIKDKDALWQKSDALEFEQKLRAEEQWWLQDREATHCLGCQSQFTWWLRRHHCRLCGRIFCYYCSNNFVMTKYGGKKERCCRECYTQHSAVVERFTRAELKSPQEPPTPAGHTHTASPPPPYKPTPRVTVTEENVKQDDGAFDIITEEEVNGLYDSDSVSQTTAESQEGEAEGRTPGEPSTSSDTAAEEQEELPPTVQDSEINLIKSGELTSSVQLHIDEISQFGDGSRELFVKSSCYSMISITVGDHGPTVGWVFSSEPKSISFSVVYRESINTPVEQAKVLIPLTRCNAHKETIQGQLKARNPGVYSLIFDNSFSRFISKKVNYHLTTEKPVIYDGSDCP
ncbi:FYVE and coiled-coil domain-containing protein 1 [Salminus brasiliensis]|uniref:FYVE and coiled-coil domain-containing protein 1 n=1 Tax=Salminus brasiliensis TaxID=930266 RepID=UPI003B838CB6